MASARDRVKLVAKGAAAATAAYAIYDVVRSPPTLADSELQVLASGFGFCEGPRWRPDEGKLYFTDMYEKKVYAVQVDGAGSAGAPELVVEASGNTSGLGWLPDGRLLVVLMECRSVAVLGADGKLQEHVSLSHLEPQRCNDMVVDSKGRCYVGGWGFDLTKGLSDKKPTCLSLVESSPGTSPHVAAADIMFPNGAVITPDGRTLIVAETLASLLTAFDRNLQTGALSNRREWAKLPGLYPDGMCLDAEGCVWVASPVMLPGNRVKGFFSTALTVARARMLTGGFLRVAEGGAIREQVLLGENKAFACVLGGEDGKTLFMLVANSKTIQPQLGDSFIAVKRVSVGAARDPGNPRYNAGYC